MEVRGFVELDTVVENDGVVCTIVEALTGVADDPVVDSTVVEAAVVAVVDPAIVKAVVAAAVDPAVVEAGVVTLAGVADEAVVGLVEVSGGKVVRHCIGIGGHSQRPVVCAGVLENVLDDGEVGVVCGPRVVVVTLLAVVDAGLEELPMVVRGLPDVGV